MIVAFSVAGVGRPPVGWVVLITVGFSDEDQGAKVLVQVRSYHGAPAMLSLPIDLPIGRNHGTVRDRDGGEVWDIAIDWEQAVLPSLSEDRTSVSNTDVVVVGPPKPEGVRR